MDRNPLDELTRSAEPADPSAGTVDRLVTGALRRGRRSLLVRRLAAGIACGALLTTGAAVAGQLPGRGVEAAPAAPTATAVPTPGQPSSTATPTPAQSATVTLLPPTPAPATETSAGTPQPPPTHLDVLKVLRRALPETSKVSQIGDDGLPGEVSVMFTLTDSDGRAFMAGGVYNDLEDLPCSKADGCTQEVLAGGNLSVMRDPGGSGGGGKAGDGTWYYFERSDGSWIWFGQRNAFQGNGPVTRPEVPLRESEVRALLTAPEWKPLVEGCRAARGAC